MPDRPNVVFVLTDQQHGKMLSCAGNEHLDTPSMDRLADTGVRFDRAYCANPVCSPSRTSLLTGRFPSVIGQRRNAVPGLDTVPEEVTAGGLGHVLRDAGYETAYGGKQHLPADMTPESLGFETLTTDERDGCADTCAEFIRADHDDPFFLVASFINPHDICYMAINDYRRAMSEELRGDVERERLQDALERPEGVEETTFFEEHAPPLPSNHEPQADEPEAVHDLIDQRPFKRYVREEWTAERWREHRWAYCRLTEMVDAQVGRLLDALDETGKRDETIVVFTSDHGDMDGAHRLEHKTVFYEEAVNVPFVVSDPDGPSDRVDSRLVSNGLDVLPTVCDYAGVDPPSHCEGRSVRPLLDGRERDWRSAVRIESELGECLVADRYKYALYDDGANREQLYDREQDPGETRNYLGENEDVTETLRDRLVDGSALR